MIISGLRAAFLHRANLAGDDFTMADVLTIAVVDPTSRSREMLQ